MSFWDNRQKIKELFMKRNPNINGALNWVKLVEQNTEGFYVEFGYWHTYLNCKPIYKKETVFFGYEELK